MPIQNINKRKQDPYYLSGIRWNQGDWLEIQDLTYTAHDVGILGNGISIEYIGGAVAGAEVVSVTGQKITVEIDPGVTTADQIKTAVDVFFVTSPDSTARVDVTVSGVGTAAQVVHPEEDLQDGKFEYWDGAAWVLAGEPVLHYGVHEGIGGVTLGIYGNVSAIRGTVTNIKGDTTNIRGLVTSISGDVSNILGDVSSLVGDVSDLTGDVSDLSGEIDDLSGTVAITGSISNITGDISGITGSVTNISGDVSNITGDVSGISGNVSNISGDVSSITGNVSELLGNVSNLTGSVAGLKGTIAYNWAPAGSPPATSLSLTGNVSNITGTITGIYGAVSLLMYGNLDTCGLLSSDRVAGVDIEDLIIP
jgi:uncharacterized protein YoxC